MEVMDWIELALAILSGLSVTIPLVIKLVEYVKKAINEKNWNVIINLVMNYMQIAETKFADGASRKEWVMSMVEASAKTINYTIDMNILSNLIDSLCAMSKEINVTPSEK